MKHFLSSVIATVSISVAGGCGQPPRAPSESSGPATEEGTIEEMLAMNDAFAALLSLDGDCDKIAVQLKAFAAKEGARVKSLKAALAELPPETLQRVQATQGARISAFGERITQADQRCGSNPEFAAAFGTLVDKRTELPPKRTPETQERKTPKDVANTMTDSLIIINGTEHGIPAASRLESQDDGLPVVVSGLGLGLILKAPALAVNINGMLLIGRRDGDYFVIRATIKPGSAPASAAPTAGTAGKTFTTGPNGPTIELEPQVESLAAVFMSANLIPNSPPSWRVMSRGMASLPLLTGMTLETVHKDYAATSVLRPGTSILDQIQLNGPYERRPRHEDFIFAGARADGEGSIVHPDGKIPWYGVTYTHEGATWRQRFYVLPGADADSCMTLKVQTRASTADVVFGLADEIAAEFWRPGPMK